MARDYPLTSADLRHLADRVAEILEVVDVEGDLPDNDWRWGLTVKVWNLDGDGDDVAGVVAPHGDGWLGFYPNDPHGYNYGTIFALGMLTGGFLAAVVYLIAGVTWG